METTSYHSDGRRETRRHNREPFSFENYRPTTPTIELILADLAVDLPITKHLISPKTIQIPSIPSTTGLVSTRAILFDARHKSNQYARSDMNLILQLSQANSNRHLQFEDETS